MISLIQSVITNDVESLRSILTASEDPDRRDKDGRCALIHAAIDNRVEAAQLLLEASADVNLQDNQGNSALHYAAQDFHNEIASLLLEHGANVDIEDIHGNTPLWRAVYNSGGRGQMIHLLLTAGADRHHRNRHGKSPADLAATIANFDAQEFLR
jgi:ankyrin repeat protein